MNHQNHHRPAIKKSAGGGGDSKAVLQPGQMIFRLLCHVDTAGGVIGNSGSLIKQLESETGCRIRFEEPLPNCHERVINIFGGSNIDRRTEVEEEVVEVSRAQEGLIRVYESSVGAFNAAGGGGGSGGGLYSRRLEEAMMILSF